MFDFVSLASSITSADNEGEIPCCRHAEQEPQLLRTMQLPDVEQKKKALLRASRDQPQVYQTQNQKWRAEHKEHVLVVLVS